MYPDFLTKLFYSDESGVHMVEDPPEDLLKQYEEFLQRFKENEDSGWDIYYSFT